MIGRPIAEATRVANGHQNEFSKPADMEEVAKMIGDVSSSYLVQLETPNRFSSKPEIEDSWSANIIPGDA